MDQQAVDQLDKVMELLVTGRPIPKDFEVSEEVRTVMDKIIRLQEMHQELTKYSITLSKGNVNEEPPSRSNYLAAGLKQLEAQLRHLTWQAQCIARGDYNQTVDFMGDFSEAFNQMTSQLNLQRNKITAQRDIMLRVFDNIEPIIVVGCKELDIQYANRMAKQRLQAREGELLPLSESVFLRSLVQSRDGECDETRQLYDEDMDRWYSVEATDLPWEGDRPCKLFYCMDITALKQREESLVQEANTDTLTGLLNRRAFSREFTSLWERCMAFHEPLAMLIFDIDHFKRFNDTYGHIRGDECLAAFAKVLKDSVTRSSDVIARYGGEEFAVLLPHTNREDAMNIGEDVRMGTEKMRLYFDDFPDHEVGITVSVGCSCVIPDRCLLPKDLFVSADKALYAAKASGRNRAHYADVTIGREDI